MLPNLIRTKLAGWLIVAATLPYATAAFAMASHDAGPAAVDQSRIQHRILASLPPAVPQRSSADEPFGQIAIPVSSGDSLSRWLVVEDQIDAEAAVLDRCLAQQGLAQQECPAPARKFLDIVAQGHGRTGLARIGMINRAVNLAIIPQSDMDQWGVEDRWSPPLETLTTGHGDCEDYAIAKYAALLRAGVASEDVKLVIVHRRLPDEEHAVAAARVGGRWFILDNRTQILVPDADMRGAMPLLVLDSSGAKMIVPGVTGTKWAASKEQLPNREAAPVQSAPHRDMGDVLDDPSLRGLRARS